MTTTSLPRVPRQAPPPPRSRYVRIAQNFFASGDFTTLLILTGMMVTLSLSLNVAEWPLSMGVILTIAIISIIFGFTLARSQFGELLSLIVSLLYGFCVVLLTTAISLGGGLGQGVYDIFVRTITWIADAFTGGINQDDMVFTLLVAALFWFLGYNASWHTFRIDRVWRVILPPGLILATNSIFYSGDASLDAYLFGFVFLALLLITRSHLAAREWEWYQSGIRAPRHLKGQFLRVAAILSMFIIIVGWAIPSGNLQERLDQFQEFLQSEPLQEISEFWNRLFSPVEAQGPTSADYYGGEKLSLGGAIRLGDQEVFLVNAPTDRRYYWRSRTFDTYESGDWTSAAEIRLHDSVSPLTIISEPDAARAEVQQEFTMALNSSRIIYTAPQPSGVDMPTRTDLFYTSRDESDPNRAMNISVIRPTKVLRRGETYTATSMMSTASATQLRTAGTNYPEWVRSLYLYVSPSVTNRTRQLAFEIVTEAAATTPYDQAKAIETFLRSHITYNETIPSPPSGQDPVDWVLFDHLQGYCNYYASSMIVMLRTLGIPSRMAAGFAQGNYDAEQGAFVVTERDAHTWVEAYFPGYGWIEFEPTAAQAPLTRDGDNEISQQLIAPPVASATPTITPSPQPSPTPNATVTPPPDDQSENPPPIPTITPTFTPTPTATPVIVPTQPAPMNPEPQNPLEVILPALTLLLLGIVVLALVIALATFIYWWWEWRGMRGLSPVVRAYARLERYVSLIGINLKRQETPEERRRQIVRSIPQAERPITAITRMYISERSGPGEKTPTETHRRSEIADQAWTETRKNILKRWMHRFMFWRRDR